MKARIKEKSIIADGTLKVVFDLLGEKLNFKAGQYFFITIPNPLYKDERGNRRHFTIVNPPEENTQLVMTTRVGPSAFKRTLMELEENTEVEVGPIGGGFTLPDDTKPLVFLAGGIGITPFMSMLQHIQKQNLSQVVTLAYSNRNQESTAYFEDLQKLEKAMDNFKLIFTMTDDVNWKGEKRRIDAQFIKDYFPVPGLYLYLVSGPPQAVEAIGLALEEAGVSKFQIKKETLSGY